MGENSENVRELLEAHRSLSLEKLAPSETTCLNNSIEHVTEVGTSRAQKSAGVQTKLLIPVHHKYSTRFRG